MAVTYTPAAADSLFPSFVGRAFDDPQTYPSHDNKRVTAVYFLKPIQDELLKHQDLLSGTVQLNVANNSGSAISAGDMLAITGYDAADNLIEVSAADRTGGYKLRAVFIALADIANGSNGSVALAAVATGLDTSGKSVGDLVYLDTTGGWTTAEPATGRQLVGVVKTVDASTGEISFFPGYGIIDGSGSSLPVDDTTSLVQDPADNTKQTRIDTGNVSAGAVRVLEMPDADVLLRKHNLSAAAAPTVNDDSTAGYAVDSRWLDTTNDKAYICVDATAGAAVWLDLTGAGGYDADLNERTGFINPMSADCTLSINDGTKTLTVTPTGASFDILSANTKITITGAKSVNWTDVEGLHFFYFDNTGTLQHTTSWDNSLLDGDKVFVAYLYWDSFNDQTILDVVEERHGAQMSGATHLSIHKAVGMVWRSGLELSNIDADQSGGSDSHAQFGVGNGTVADEDNEFSISTISSTTGLPIIYLNGSTPDLRETSQAGFAVKTTGSGRLAYNQYSAGSWSLAEVPNGDYVLCHVLAANSNTDGKRVYAMIGQNSYTTRNAARAGAETEMNSLLTQLDLAEIRPLATVIFQTSNSYGNTVKARIRTTADGNDYIDWRKTNTPASGGVTATTADGVSVDTTDFDNILSSTDNNVQTALETIDDHNILDHAAASSPGVLLNDGSGSLSWRGIPEFKNAIINGDARVKQADDITISTGLSESQAAMAVDMWKAWWSGTGPSSITLGRDTSASVGRTGYAHKWTGTFSGTDGILTWRYRVDAKTASRFEGQALTFSCLVRHDVGSDVTVKCRVYKADATNDFSSKTQLGSDQSHTVASATNTSVGISLTSGQTSGAKNGLEIQIEFTFGVAITG
ncbi:MAG: hypothetical protein DRH24_18265, partial [Deltaproteobacteria bacterium]